MERCYLENALFTCWNGIQLSSSPVWIEKWSGLNLQIKLQSLQNTTHNKAKHLVQATPPFEKQATATLFDSCYFNMHYRLFKFHKTPSIAWINLTNMPLCNHHKKQPKCWITASCSLPVMHSTMPPRCIHPALPFLLKKWIIWRGENALNMALSYLIMLYTPMTAMEINHSRNIGANMTPTLAVPNRCTLKRSTKVTSEIIVTASAKVAKTECHSYIQSSFELWRCRK